MIKTPRWYQRSAIDETWLWLTKNKGDPVIVLPTATGKALCIAMFIKEALQAYPGTRIGMITHVSELIEQNHLESSEYWPDAPLGTFGINSAKLKTRNTDSPVLFAGIQSVYNKAMQLGHFDLLLVDECHRIPKTGEGQYQTFIKKCREINPSLRVVGFTATPYRMGLGYVYGPGKIFNDVSFELGIKDAIDQGYVCPLISTVADVQADVSKLHLRAGEYIDSEMDDMFDSMAPAIVDEIIAKGVNRNHWMVFTPGVKAAEHFNEEFLRRGVSSVCITGNTSNSDRSRWVNEYKNGQHQCLVNCGIFTEGFNYTKIDLVALALSTKSPGKYVQIIGREFRIDPEKDNGLVLDFGGNIEEHGPIDNVNPPVDRSLKRCPACGKMVPSEDKFCKHCTHIFIPEGAPVKKCPECETDTHAGAKICDCCGYEFPPPETKLSNTASNKPILSQPEPPQEWIVNDIVYERHEKEGKIPSMKVTYYQGYQRICSEWICIGHEGFARHKAELWWARRTGWDREDTPFDVDTAIKLANTRKMLEPTKIWTVKEGKFERISDYELPPLPDALIELTMKQVEKPWLEDAVTIEHEVDDIPF
ncbi:MAG: DEAD/DEAH box helicase [Thiolinea sp.]